MLASASMPPRTKKAPAKPPADPPPPEPKKRPRRKPVAAEAPAAKVAEVVAAPPPRLDRSAELAHRQVEEMREHHGHETASLRAELAALGSKVREADELRQRLADLEQRSAEQAAKRLQRDGEMLRSAGERIELLEHELATQSSQVAALQQLVAESDERSHDRELGCAALTSDLASAGARILDLEIQLVLSRERISLYAEAAAEAGQELEELEEQLARARPSPLSGVGR